MPLHPQLPRGATRVPPALISRLARVLPPTTTILSGAGISTESGLSDYRSPGKPPSRPPISHNDFVSDPRVRQTYWARSFVGYPVLSTARPNAAHRAITALRDRGFRHITQNVDGLAPGLMLHGTVHRVICLECRAREERELFQKRLRSANPGLRLDAVRIRPDGDADLSERLFNEFNVPGCKNCERGVLMPDLVFHGGTVPKDVAHKASDIVDKSEALLIVGSTVTPYSAYRLVQRAKRNDSFLACMNFGVTRGDDLYDIKLEGLVGDAMTRLAAALLKDFEWGEEVAGTSGGCLRL